MTPEEAVAMELVNIAMAITEHAPKALQPRDVCDVLLARAIYVINKQQPLVEVDDDVLQILRHAIDDADHWVAIVKGEQS